MADEPRIRPSGTFADPTLEREFQADDREGQARFLRFSLVLASAVFLAYGLHDAWVVPSVRERAWLVRYGVFLPVAAATLAIVATPRLARFWQPAMLAYGSAASFVVLYIGAISPPEGFFLYTSYAVVFVTLGPFVARMTVATQSAYTLVTLVAYNSIAESHGAVRASISITIVSLGGIGALLAYRLERQARESFLQRRAIRRLLLNVLPERIAERLETESGAIAEGFPTVSVLFADIVGFTRMTQRITPEELVARLNLVFSSFDDLADKLELEKIKTIGDAYMVAAGLGAHVEDHALAMAEMALAMQRRVAEFSQQFGETLAVRIGIDSGPVVAGVIGKRKFSYDVWGDTVNTASRMESHAEPGTIQVTQATYELLKNAYELAPRGEIEIKGKGKMKTWLLVQRLPEPDGRRSAKTRVPWKLGDQSH
jgi:class 3 adenylate cyclase